MTRYRTSHRLRLRWDDDAGETGLVARLPGTTGEPVALPRFEAVSLLRHALAGRTREELRSFAETDLGCEPGAAGSLVGFLVENGLVVPVERWPAGAARWFDAEWHQALHYHLATRDREPALDPGALRRGAGGGAGREAAGAEPGRGRDGGTGAEAVPLPEPEPLPGTGLDEVLVGRRTCREFAGRPVGLGRLSSVLHHALRPTRARRRDPEAAADALTPLSAIHVACEVYVGSVRVDGLEPGIYRYAMDEHALVPAGTGLGDDPEAADETVRWLLYDQPHCDGAAAVAFLVVDLERYRSLCRDGVHLRHCVMAVSGLLQRLLLTGVAFDLGVFQSIAVRDGEADDLVGADGVDRTTAYLAALGHGGEP